MCPEYHWKNKETEEYQTVVCSIADIDKFLETVPDPDNWFRVMQLPQVRTEKLSASFLDGHVPASKKKDFDDLKQAAKIEADSYNLKPEDRKEHKKAIKQLKEVKK